MIPRAPAQSRRRTKRDGLLPSSLHMPSNQPASGLSLFWLGAPRVECGSTLIEFENHKATALLAYLTVTSERHTRDTLAALLWPESDRTHARAALRNILWVIRKTLGEEWLDVERDSIDLNYHVGWWVDVDHFHRQLAGCRTHGHPADEICPACLTALTEAATVYQADFLTGFTLADSPAFDEWQLLQTEELRRELFSVLEKLVHYHSRQEDFESAIAYTQRWLTLDPLQESAHRQLMQLYTQTDQRPAALRQYQECVRVLAREVGVAPQPETTQLFQSLQAKQLSLFAQGISPANLVPRYNLPLQPTPFVGREKEITEIVRLLAEPTCKLLTLTGLGGIGKTRLAIQVAAEMRNSFSQGICFVPLASLSSSDLLVATIANALEFSFHDQQSPRTQLLDYLREKALLLILDDFEPLNADVNLLGEILQHAHHVKLLVTSRERLNLRWEWLLGVEGLEFPEENKSEEEIENYNAGQLFVQNASRVQPDFSLTAEDGVFVARICRQVAGMPLAIELASAWVRLFSCREIAERIRNDSNFLVSTLRDVPPRQQSLHAVFECSWGLLSAEEKKLLVRLTVFQGGFSLEAASHVTAASPFVLSELIDKSLLRRLTKERCQLWDVIKQYAAEKFQETSQTEAAIRNAHSAYYAEFLQQREHQLRSPQRRMALKEIGEEIGNVQAGWMWAVEQVQVETIARALESLYLFYEAQGWCQIGEEAFRRAAAKLNELEEGTEKNLIRGRILARQGVFAQQVIFFDHHQTPEKAVELLRVSLALLREVGHQREIAFTLNQLGLVVSETGDTQTAQQLSQEALAICQEIGDPSGIARSLKNLGNVAYKRGEPIAAQSLWEQSLVVSRGTGDLIHIARTLNNLGLSAGYLEQPTTMKSRFLEMYTVSKESGEKTWIAYSLLNLGDCAYQQREYAEAQQSYEEGLAIFKEIGHRGGIALSLLGLGKLACQQGEPETAKQVYQESLALVKETGDQAYISEALAHLGEATYTLGECQESKQYFHEAIKLALEIRAVPLMSAPLLGIARLWAKEGKQTQALEFLAVIRHYPVGGWQVKDNVQRFFAELESQLSPTLVAEVCKKGEGRMLEESAEMACAFLQADLGIHDKVEVTREKHS